MHPGDTVIDLTFGINCIDILSWCQANQVRYINTAVEKWEDELIPDNAANWIGDIKEEKVDWTVKHKDLYDRTLYARHQDIINNGFSGSGPTAVLEHGCNPGLVSHFVRAALDDIVVDLIKSVPSSRLEEIRVLHSSGDYPRLAHALGLRVIHISEIDTQTTSANKSKGEFVNTWSPMGFAEEALDWVQVGWGTHERPLPRMLVPSHGTCNQVFVPMHAMDLVMDSYVPHTPIKGMCIPHGEADTITEALTVYDDDDSSSDGSGEDSDDSANKCVTSQGEVRNARNAVYRPSVYYVYQCAGIALESLEEMRKSNYVPQSQYHVLVPSDGLKGEDRVGVLLMFEDDPARTVLGESDEKTRTPYSYWYGSILSDANNEMRNFGPTVVQVAASVVAAYNWIQENPDQGVCWPDNLPHKYILDMARPFLGTVVSAQMKDYVPPKSLQFSDFICSPG
jgi:homospermidine synthase